MPAALATLLVVLSSAAVLVLEVLVSRLVAPYVGLTLETYTAAIGVTLAAIAAGAALGGRLADRADPRRWLGLALALGGGLVLSARPLVFAVGRDFRGLGTSGTVVLVLLAVAPAALVLSTVTPAVIKLRLRTLEETGQTVGRLSAAGTLGALAGTFLTGFVLLAALPTSRLLLLTGVLLLATGLTVAVALRAVAAPGPLVAVTALAALTGTWMVTEEGTCQMETRYYCAAVERDEDRPGGRALVLDGVRHSYVDLDDPAHLEFDYIQRIGDVLGARPSGPLDVLHLGGGGFTVPGHLGAVRPGSRSTVLEVDPGVVELGRDRLGLVTGPDLQVLVGDARTAIEDQPTDAFDVVVGDAFGSTSVPWHLTTAEMVEQVSRVLRPDGVYVLNLIDHPPLRFARAEVATLLAGFTDVVLVNGPDEVLGSDGGNLVVVASDDVIDDDALSAASRAAGRPVSDRAELERFARGAQVLTDDDAPVDQLLTPYPRT